VKEKEEEEEEEKAFSLEKQPRAGGDGAAGLPSARSPIIPAGRPGQPNVY
jgi:hypothetical protein